MRDAMIVDNLEACIGLNLRVVGVGHVHHRTYTLANVERIPP